MRFIQLTNIEAYTASHGAVVFWDFRTTYTDPTNILSGSSGPEQGVGRAALLAAMLDANVLRVLVGLPKLDGVRGDGRKPPITTFAHLKLLSTK